MKQRSHKHVSQAMVFILLFSIVSLFSDMTHEGASSIRGAYVSLLGASATVIGFMSGLGELVGYSLRYLFGKLTDKTHKYWPMTVIGYTLDIIAVPALALVGEHGWIMASMLLVVQRMGKAIKKPAKDTIMSFAATQEGVGKSFAIQEVLDQIGACLGPVLLYFVMLGKSGASSYDLYRLSFAVLAIPAVITLVLLGFTWRKFPNPQHFEPTPAVSVPFRMHRRFVLYIVGISLFAFGFIDYALIIMHVSRTQAAMAAQVAVPSFLLDVQSLPLLYAAAMFIDAIAALVFGLLYDKVGLKSLVWATLIAAPSAFFVFGLGTFWSLVVGIMLWGVGMGAQETVLKAAVATMVPKDSRATGYGIFECWFGISWFLGSWLMGYLYDQSLLAMVIVSCLVQVAAIPCFLLSQRASRQMRA